MPRMVGGPSVIKQGFPKAGGVMLFCDFLNPPGHQFPLVAHSFENAIEIDSFFSVDYSNLCATNKNIGIGIKT